MAERPPDPSSLPDTLEIVIPVRNPTEVFRRTVESLLAQTDRSFTVLVSDNYSRSGLELIAAAKTALEAAGIAMRIVQPPVELGRVQHWNWLHHQSTAEWLKPLFVGDWLEPDCVAACREEVARDPEVAFLYFQFFHHQDGQTQVLPNGSAKGRVPKNRIAERAIHEGNFLGGPINVLYRKWAFQALGGHQTSLPYLADFDLYARLALTVPSFYLDRPLGHFLVHDARFTLKGAGQRRESMNIEYAIMALLMRYAGFQSGHVLDQTSFLLRLVRLTFRVGSEFSRRAAGIWWKKRRPSSRLTHAAPR